MLVLALVKHVKTMEKTLVRICITLAVDAIGMVVRVRRRAVTPLRVGMRHQTFVIRVAIAIGMAISARTVATIGGLVGDRPTETTIVTAINSAIRKATAGEFASSSFSLLQRLH